LAIALNHIGSLQLGNGWTDAWSSY